MVTSCPCKFCTIFKLTSNDQLRKEEEEEQQQQQQQQKNVSHNVTVKPYHEAMTSISLLQVGSRKGSSAWTTVSHWSRRSPNLPTCQSRLLVSILFPECEHSFSNKPLVITEPQSTTESVKKFALSYSKETRPANLAPWWPLPPPFPGQCCLVGSKNRSRY